MALREIKFTLNGEPTKLLVDSKRSLMKVLREDLRLTGTKEGCGDGTCGACTVLLDGRPVNSCLLSMDKVEGRSVTTIEGVGTISNPDPIQVAFVKVGASQCGFCTPGMILNAKAILDSNPNPTKQEIRKRLSRNLCRCTGYNKIIEGILLAAELRKDPEKFKAVLEETRDRSNYKLGGRVPQLNSWEKVTGKLQFAEDMFVDNMCYAKVLRSPHFHALIKNIDTSEAEKMNGVICVATAKDLKGPNRVKYIFDDFRVIADEKVRYWGEPVAIVVALTEEIATAALDKIKVDYEPLPAVKDPFEAMKPGAPNVQDEYPGNILFTQNLIKGDVEEGFKEADIIEENVYTTPANAHGYLEPDAGIGYIDDEGRVCIVACGQAPHYHRDEIAKVLGLGTDQVRVVEKATGGGFGARIDPFLHVLLALAVYKARRPVKLQFTMAENFLGYCKRHPFYIKMKTGVKKDGRVVAHYAEIVTDAGAYALASPAVLMRATVHSYGPYEFPHVKVLGKTVLTNNTPSSAMRGFGVSQMCFAVESQMNKLAKRLGMDLLEFEKMNGFKQGSVTATGQVLKEDPGYRQVIEKIQEHWAQKPKYTDPAELAKLPPHIKRGKGFATTWYGIGKTGLLNLSRAKAEIIEGGRLRIREGAAEIGQGVTTVMALIGAEEMKLPLSQVEVIDADTLETPDSDITCASKHTFYTGNATLMAVKDLKKKIFAAAGEELGCEPDNMDTADGWVFDKSNPDNRISLKDLYDKGYELKGEGEFVVPLDLLDRETGQGTLYVVFTYGAACLEIEVNTLTGEIKVLDAAVCFQCGKAINRLGMEGQMEGGVAMGVGYALMEEYITGKTLGFKQYKIPRADEVPDMVTYTVEVPQSLGPYGAIGMGEAAHFPMAPAIMAALHDACGIWINDLPATPEKVLKALREKEAAAAKGN